jgi:uncharacterized membrane-anchored protein YjiN (DUF445 family)
MAILARYDWARAARRAVRTRRRLAGAVLVGAAVLAVAAFPFRSTWWGGWILAMAEAGVVGGLADWFAVTALFRRPLGLPIPHTGLIPANWEMLAARVGTMVGDRVLTREYLAHEIARVDVSNLVVRAADRVRRADVEAVTRTLLDWVVREIPAGAAGDLVTRLSRWLADRPAAPVLASALDLARRHGWDQRVVAGVAGALASALDKPEVRRVVGELIDELLARYRERTPFYPRLALSLADLFGVIDRDRMIASLRTGLAAVAADDAHPVRRHLLDEIARLGERLRGDTDLAARVEQWKADVLASPLAARVVEDALAAARRMLGADLGRSDSVAVAVVADRVERWRRALVEDVALRESLDRWAKARVIELVERHHGQIATFIEKGVHALGPEGAVRLIEEHAGDDLQFIRVNGTVVGGLAGAGLYAIHLLVRALTG